MKIIKQYSNIWGECPSDFIEACKWAERGGRFCWKSDDKITEDSYKQFLSGIMKSGHLGVLEASNLVTIASEDLSTVDSGKFLNRMKINNVWYVGGNFRAWIEHTIEKRYWNSFESLTTLVSIFAFTGTQVKKESIPIELKRISVELITNRAMTHQIVRHRPCSFLQESQRYVDMSNPAFILPVELYGKEGGVPYECWEEDKARSEETYKKLRDYGLSKQVARGSLPNDTATRILVTADIPEWNLIFSLRLAKGADPQVKDLLGPVYEEFKQKDWIL